MKKIGWAVGLALAMAALVLAWGEWRGTHLAGGTAAPATVFGDVVINEVAWMGTAAEEGSYDEWIELYNTTGRPITLTGWTLSDGGDIDVTLGDTIPARGYFLLERADDATVSNVLADQIYHGSLNNGGEALTLTNETGNVMDTANGDGGAWPAGDNATKATMERIEPTASDADANWVTNDGVTRNGLDAAGNPINGTPKARNSSTTLPGLAVEKSGPPILTAGLTFTNRIALSNTGTLTLHDVVVTDVLLSGLTFIVQASPFIFTQPASDTLVWEAGALPSGTLRLITLTLRSDETFTGTLTNVVTATDATGRVEVDAWSASLVPHVRLYALHPHAVHSGDEAVALINLGASVAALGGWELSDGGVTTRVSFPEASVPPGDIIWVADDADDFVTSFGFAPNFALSYMTHTVPLLAGSWPGFANDGDEVILFDGTGHVVDTLVYGDGLTTTLGWHGEAVPYPRSGFGKGQILYRKLDQATGLPVPDTDAAVDWAQATDDDVNGKKVRYPGWDVEEFFFPAQVTETAAITVWVAPDGLYEGMAGMLKKARSNVLIEAYTFESAELAGVVTGLVQSGVSVTMLLEGQPAFGLDDQELWTCGKMADAGARVYFMHSDSEARIYDRYDQQHAKLIVVDGTTVLLGSENFSLSGMPADPKADGTWGHRGIYLATDAPGVVTRAQAIFERDLDLVHNDIVPWGSHGYTAPAVFTPTYGTNWVTYTAHFSQPLTVVDEFAFEVIHSPENSLRDRDALLGLLARAGSGDVILVEQLYEHRSWDGGINPRLEAYVAAARRGATVRLLLDGYYDDGRNQTTVDYVNGTAQSEGLDLEARLGNPTGEGIHSKMVLAWIGDRGYIHVGSINGSEAAHKVNRELALQVQSDEAYQFLKSVFDDDWQASWSSSPHATRIYLPLVGHNYVPPADHLVVSELLYDPVGVADAEGEWIEIYNPTSITTSLDGYSLSDGSSYGDGTATFPAVSNIGPGDVVVVAQTASGVGFVPDYELRESDPAVPNLTPVSGSISWGNSGDEAILRDASGVDVDVVVYGSGSYPDMIPHPGVRWGHSLERKPADRDTDDCSADFWERYTPSPGQVTVIHPTES